MSIFDFCALVIGGLLLYCRYSVAAQAARYEEFMGKIELHYPDDSNIKDEVILDK